MVQNGCDVDHAQSCLKSELPRAMLSQSWCDVEIVQSCLGKDKSKAMLHCTKGL